MPGVNCAIYGCNSSRGKNPEKSFFKIPLGNNDFDKSWKEKLVAVICKARVVDDNLRRQIDNSTLRICSDHFSLEQMLQRK